jgi:DNA-binding response OmpR family regulator
MLDIDYGGAAGRSLLSALQPTGLLAHIKVLAVGSRAAESDIRMALDMGATDIIRKPFPITLLLHRVKQMLAS